MKYLNTRLAKALLFSFLFVALHAVFGPIDNAFAVDEGNQPMYRLYNKWSGEHFYTGNDRELRDLKSIGWTYEGIGWIAPNSSDTPVYRLYNKWSGDHHFTINYNEYQTCIAQGWTDEGVGWYSSDAKEMPVYREFNPYVKSFFHNYTANKSEHDHLTSIGWKDEQIGWYGLNSYAGKAFVPADAGHGHDFQPVYAELKTQVGWAVTCTCGGSTATGFVWPSVEAQAAHALALHNAGLPSCSWADEPVYETKQVLSHYQCSCGETKSKQAVDSLFTLDIG